MLMPPKQAKQNLLFYVAQDLDQSIRAHVQQLVDQLGASRVWSIGPPCFIDETGEQGTQLVGGSLEIYSALRPDVLSFDLDAQNLEDVERLIIAVRVLSEKESLSFEFQLGTAYVGSIADGVIDRVLLDGLLVPWREKLRGMP